MKLRDCYYTPQSLARYLVPGAICGDGGHSRKIGVKIGDPGSGEPKVTLVKYIEKCRESAIYEKMVNQAFDDLTASVGFTFYIEIR